VNPLPTKADLNDPNTIEYPWPKRSGDRIEESLPMSCLAKLTQSGHQSTLVLRLVLGCRHNAILLASILKYRGIPARVRYGHATYIIPDFHVSHVICEVWNENDNRWMLVDPSTVMVDFSREKFDFSNDAWLKMQKKEIDPNLFGIPRKYTGSISITAKLCHDLASILGTEYTTYQFAPIIDDAVKNDHQLTLTSKQIETLNRISELMKSIDTESISQLQEIYSNTPQIQITKSFEPNTRKSENNTRNKDTSNK